MNAIATAPLVLTHRQEIRVKGFRYCQRITVFTVAGYALEYGEDPVASIERSKSFGHDVNPSASQDCAMLTADYPGKTAELDAKAAATAAAPEIEAGQVVEIEGALYTVRVTGQQFSDPVHFRPLL